MPCFECFWGSCELLLRDLWIKKKALQVWWLPHPWRRTSHARSTGPPAKCCCAGRCRKEFMWRPSPTRWHSGWTKSCSWWGHGTPKVSIKPDTTVAPYGKNEAFTLTHIIETGGTERQLRRYHMILQYVTQLHQMKVLQICLIWVDILSSLNLSMFLLWLGEVSRLKENLEVLDFILEQEDGQVTLLFHDGSCLVYLTLQEPHSTVSLGLTDSYKFSLCKVDQYTVCLYL